MSRKPTAQEIYEKQRKRRFKRDYKFKEALLSADLPTVKATLKSCGIPYSLDDAVLVRTIISIIASINDRPIEVVQAALRKYDEQLKLLQSTNEK